MRRWGDEEEEDGGGETSAPSPSAASTTSRLSVTWRLTPWGLLVWCAEHAMANQAAWRSRGRARCPRDRTLAEDNEVLRAHLAKKNESEHDRGCRVPGAGCVLKKWWQEMMHPDTIGW